MRWLLLSLLFLLVGCGDSSSPETDPEQEQTEQNKETEVQKETNLSQVPTSTDTFEAWKKFDDPASDGWETEVFSDEASGLLKNLGKAILGEGVDSAKSILSENVSDFFTPQSSAPSLETTTVPGEFEIKRWSFSSDSQKEKRGIDEVFSKLCEDFHPSGSQQARLKFKITSVQKAPDDSQVVTEVLVESFGIHDSRAVEQHSTWEVVWISEEDQPHPRIASIKVLETELTARPHSDRLFFSDLTRSALEHDPTYRTQVLRGLPFWLERQNRRRATDVYGFPGISVGDVNGDGLEDLFLCESQGVPHCLFIQNPDGTLTNKAADWKVDWLEDARSALLVDLDNDGDQDLVVAAIGFVLVASNEGDSFQLQATLPCSEDVTHLSAADFDLDGRLDLYVSAYLKSKIARPTQIHNPGYYIDANGGAPNFLFRNQGQTDGTWAFANVTEETGLDTDNLGQTLSSAWEDFDQDGDPDLYVANDFGSNPFYRNDVAEDGTRTFTNISNDTGSKDTAFGMSAAWGDYNRDGWMDLYVANMWSSAGKRVMSQPEFKPGIEEEEREFFQHFARGNTLLKNTGEGGFEDVSEEAGVVMGRWAWSSPFVDLNNDGWEDFVVANGYITGTGPGDL